MSRHKHKHIHKHSKIFKPRDKGHLCNVDLPAAGTAWLSSNIKPKHTPTAIRISTSTTISGVIKAIISRSDGTVITTDLNRGDPLVPSALYVFEVMLHKHDRLNVSYDTTAGTIQFARFEEIDASTASGRAGY
jgi:hypothetical protein